MKVTTTLTALVIGIASMGMAQAAETSVSSSAGHDAYYPNLVEQNNVSRADVVKQLQQAEATGMVTTGHDPYYPQMAATKSESRDQVVSELQKAQANGDLASAGHDAYYPAHPAV